MNTVTVLDQDSHGRLSVDLRDILDALGNLTREVQWTISGCEALGAGTKTLYAAQDKGAFVTSEELLSAARQLDQVIDGIFRGYAKTSVDAAPAVIVAAVDSTSWDVSSDDEGVLERIRARFHNVYEAGDVGYGAEGKHG